MQTMTTSGEDKTMTQTAAELGREMAQAGRYPSALYILDRVKADMGRERGFGPATAIAVLTAYDTAYRDAS